MPQVTAQGLTVSAETQNFNVSLGLAGGEAGTTSFNGVVNYVGMNDTTLAQIGLGAVITTNGYVSVTADDSPENFNFAGGISKSTSVGFGITVGINNITRNTNALIGDQNVTLGNFTPDTGVNASQNTIDLGYVDGFSTGEQVIYSSGGDDSIDGLVDGNTYYVGVVSPTTITLGRSPEEAEGAAEAALGDVYTEPTFDDMDLGSDDETINLGYDDLFQNGDPVDYDQGDAALFGLTNGQTYYVIVVDATHVQLSSTPGGAPLTLTPSTSGSGSSLRLALNAGGNSGVRDNIGRTFSPDGSQQLSNNASGGTFTLTVTVLGTPETTTAINYNADASVLQTALNSLPGVTAAQVVDSGTGTWIISGVVVTVTDSLTGGQSTLQSYAGAVTSTYDSINVGYVDGFTQGQAVYYSAGNDPVIPGLTNNTVYYVVPDVSNPEAFQLAATAANALLPTPVIIPITPTATSGTSTGFGAIFDPTAAVSTSDPTQLNLGYNDSFTNGQAVIYSDGGGSHIGGLTDGATYYITVVDNTTVTLSTNSSNPAGSVVTLDPTTAIGILQNLRVAIDPQTAVTAGDTTTVSTINLGYNAGFVTGDQVYYNDGGGSNIGGLANENAYFVIVVQAGTPSSPEIIRLASSLANAMSGVYIDLDATVASGLQSIAKPFRADPVVVGNDIQVSNANLYYTGQEVVYHDGNGTPIGGLTDDTPYYVTVVDPTDITLSTDPNNLASTVVSLDAAMATGNDHYLSDPNNSSVQGSVTSTDTTTVQATNEGLFVTGTIAAAFVGKPRPAIITPRAIRRPPTAIIMAWQCPAACRSTTSTTPPRPTSANIP